MKSLSLTVWQTIKPILIFVSFLIVVSCNRDNSDSIVGNPELDLENKGITLETISYSDKDLPEISTFGTPINAIYDPRGKLIGKKYYPTEKVSSFSGSYELSSGKYKMRVSEALICPAGDKYIYFHFRVRNEFWLDTDSSVDGPHPAPYSRFEDGPYYETLPNKVRIYLDPPIDSNVVKHTTHGTLLTEYNFRVIIEITGKGELDNPCATIDSSRDRSNTIVETYLGRLISVFERNQ